jgi:peptide/nickel transport system substrate-binding protein
MTSATGVATDLVLHWPASAKTFSPFSTLSLPSWFPVWFIFDQLVHLDENANLVPQLAASWEVSDDGRQYLFHLRDDVTWHDGQPFTASDVAFTYTMLVDPRSGSRYRSLASPIRGTDEYSRGEAQTVEGLRVLDDATIEMELSRPNFGFVPSMGFPIMPAHILGDLGADEELDSTDFALRSPIGTGPFSLESHSPGGDAVFASNPTFWGGSPQVDRIILRRLDDEKALEAFEAGEIDIMFIDALDAKRVLARPGVVVKAFTTNEYRTIVFNPDNPILSDRRVREAILIAIDREAIVTDVLKGMGNVVYSHLIMPEWTVNHDLDGQYPHNPERARALLAEAGHGAGFSLGITTGPGAIPARHNAPFLGEVQRYLAEVGIETEVNVKPVVEYVADL